MNKISQTLPYQYDTVFSPFRAKEFAYALEYIALQGFTGVEIAVAHPGQVDGSKLYNLLESFGLSATTLSTGQAYDLDGLCLSSFDEEIRKRSVELMAEHVDLSACLGYPCVTVGLIRGKLEKGDKRNLLENLKTSLMKCVEYAFKHGVTLQLEPICRAETLLINNISEALTFLNELDDPENLGILYDTYHSWRENEAMTDAVKAAAGRITNVHFADSNRGLPGTGTINFGEVYEAIKNTGYKGAYALETLTIPSADHVKIHSAVSIMSIINVG
jgi:sugar phosphate isomerase/epimerase